MFRYEPTRFSKTIAAFDANDFTCSRTPAVSTNFGRRDPTEKETQIKSGKRSLGCCSKSKNGDAPWRLYNTDRFILTLHICVYWPISEEYYLIFLGINVVKMVP